jgi:hypothetical protein
MSRLDDLITYHRDRAVNFAGERDRIAATQPAKHLTEKTIRELAADWNGHYLAARDTANFLEAIRKRK